MSKKKKRVIRLFVGEHCEPCKPIEKLVGEGRFLIDGEGGGGAEIIDLETEEGFKMIEKYDLKAVPQAVDDDEGAVCRIEVDDENKLVLFECTDESEDKGA